GSLSVKGTDLGGKLSLSGKLPAIALNMEAETLEITAKDVNKTQAVKANFSVYVSEEGNTYVDIADKNIDTTLSGLSKVANDLIKDLGYDQIINASLAASAEEGSEEEPASFEIDLLAMLNEAFPNRKFYTTGSQMEVSPTAWSLAGAIDPQSVSLLFPLLQNYQLDDNFQFTTYKDGGVGVKLSVNKADIVGTLALVANSMDDDTKASLAMAGALIDSLVENLNFELAVVLDKNGCISYVGESESLKVSGKLEDMIALTGAEMPFEIKGTFELGCTTSVSVNAKYSNNVTVDVPSDLSKYVLVSNAQ
nr:hypothetical protein [Bacilli bacterium]